VIAESWPQEEEAVRTGIDGVRLGGWQLILTNNLATYTSPISVSASRQHLTCDEQPVVDGQVPKLPPTAVCFCEQTHEVLPSIALVRRLTSPLGAPS